MARSRPALIPMPIGGQNPRIFNVLSEIFEIRLRRTEHQFRPVDKSLGEG
jgi:hypothetical protein